MQTSTICTLPGKWIDEIPEVFSKTSDMSVLKRVRTFLTLNMPYSDHLFRVYKLHPTYRQKWQVIQRIAIEKSPGVATLTIKGPQATRIGHFSLRETVSSPVTYLYDPVPLKTPLFTLFEKRFMEQD
ncbi:hypothetical protein ACRRTK_009387 [Alexandromys fortis]